MTEGAAALELVPINQGQDARPAYQLQLRNVGSEAPPSDLGVYCVTPIGYPVQRWYSRNAWEDHPDKPAKDYLKVDDLEGHFKWMVSDPESRLVVLVIFFQQRGQSPFHETIGKTERELLEGALQAASGNKSAAAAALGMKLSTFRDKLVKHGLG